ncbi:acyl transferase/acyl hydrolase/lysophospholipase [Hygrophoropsis aurantiaca]|uniref:Acyl transferase/acyl hydrolase/lysophospholipase n=1 Tax=Hygrophoropsis aurantiaca TaxID=72124 RepID=A0ACB8A3L7_9AGAM|nr:acyl transferase/acyl hydrolase/lysophospholipase [Hygrophoropsis aurantiaca]
MPKVRKYILSLDGGGFRGLSCLIILSQLMRGLVEGDPDEEPIPSPCQIFDLICGTSTGGLIAILLGRLGLDCSTAISIYKKLGPSVFGRDEGKIWGNIIKGERFSSTAFETLLTEIVKNYTGDENALMKVQKSKPDAVEHGSTDTFVTVVPAGVGSAGTEAYRLRTYAVPRDGFESAPPGHSWTIRQAARATSAAPMYFAPLQIESQAFQDAAASGFNNPTLEALQEAELRWPTRQHEFVIISLGTGLCSLLPDDFDDQPVANPDDKAFDKVVNNLRNKFKNITTAKARFEQVAKQLVSVATDTELTHGEAAKRFKKWKRSENYFRFNPPQGLGDIDLADYMNEGTIIEITNVWLRSDDGKFSTSDARAKLQAAYNV